MTDLEISKALALAIGWTPNRIINKGKRIVIATSFFQSQEFDYRDWNVIGPIAEKYGMFPHPISTTNYAKAKRQGYTEIENWEVIYNDYRYGNITNAKWHHVVDSNPQRAIAFAVIERFGK